MMAALFIASVVYAFTFLATVRWVRLGDDEPSHAAQPAPPEPRRPTWARP